MYPRCLPAPVPRRDSDHPRIGLCPRVIVDCILRAHLIVAIIVADLCAVRVVIKMRPKRAGDKQHFLMFSQVGIDEVLVQTPNIVSDPAVNGPIEMVHVDRKPCAKAAKSQVLPRFQSSIGRCSRLFFMGATHSRSPRGSCTLRVCGPAPLKRIRCTI